MPTPFLLYGATGFTGALAAEEAVAHGLTPILAGRSEARLRPLAERLGLAWRVASLDDPRALAAALADMPLVLHAAGPYMTTARPMVEACLRVGVHYLDITGELPVFMSIHARDAEAERRGIMLLPGIGFDVAPTDCLAVHLKGQLPGATHLTLAFQISDGGGISRGTAKSAVGLLGAGSPVRQNGRLVTVPFAAKTRQIDFGHGPRPAVLLPWGDVFTAYHSTGIPNIEDYLAVSKTVSRLAPLARLAQPAAALPGVRGLLERAIERGPAGPSAEQRARARTTVWGEVVDGRGGRAAARLYGPEPGYTWTPRIMVAAVERILGSRPPTGYQTPATAFGADFILDTGDDVRREDLP